MVATSLAAILGASLADNLAPLLFQYTTDNYTEDILVSPEQISFLMEALPNLSAAPVRFVYALGGQRSEEELERGSSLALLLTPEEVSGLNLEALIVRPSDRRFYGELLHRLRTRARPAEKDAT